MSEFRCSLCNALVVAPGICVDCARNLGVVAMPPPRRPPAPCARCSHMKFVRVIPREYDSGSRAPMTLTSAPQTHTIGGMISSTTVSVTSAELGYGLLETYVCKKCGYVEWYCHDPERIPIGPQYMTDEVDYDSPSPYR